MEQTRDLASIDLQEILLLMRRQRLGLIQTPDQLRFSYIAVLQGALQDLEVEPSNYDDLSDSEEDVPEEESEEESDSEGVCVCVCVGVCVWVYVCGWVCVCGGWWERMCGAVRECTYCMFVS